MLNTYEVLDHDSKFTEYVLESPGAKTFFSAVIPIVTAILSGTFIVEITTPSGLDWMLFYKTVSFYAICLLTAIIYWYFREIFLYESEVRLFLDNDYCVAYMRSKCLPEAANKFKQLIRDGDGGELKQAMDELREILK